MTSTAALVRSLYEQVVTFAWIAIDPGPRYSRWFSQALWDELKGFEREGAKPNDAGATEIVEIVMATGSYDVRGWTFALGAFVNKDNPLSKLSMEQLDGIFGA